jgi:hypothetical protein
VIPDRSATEAVDEALRRLRRAVVKHPFAAQSIHAALVREGRAFAETEEGRLVRERLLRSEIVTRMRSAWEIVTFGMLAEPTTGGLPSTMAEAFVHSVLLPSFEARLHRGLRAPARGPGEPSDDLP